MMYKLLVVDDQSGIRMLLCEVLKKEGYKVFEAANGIQAMEVVVEEKPDLVLLDMKLPGMDGIEVLKLIKEDFPHISVMMMTAYRELNIIEKALELGAVAHFTKPFDLQDIREAIKNELQS